MLEYPPVCASDSAHRRRYEVGYVCAMLCYLSVYCEGLLI